MRDKLWFLLTAMNARENSMIFFRHERQEKWRNVGHAAILGCLCDLFFLSETLALLAVFSKSEALLCVLLWLSRMRDKLWFLLTAMNAREKCAMWAMKPVLAAIAAFNFLTKPWRSLRFFPKAKLLLVLISVHPWLIKKRSFYQC